MILNIRKIQDDKEALWVAEDETGRLLLSSAKGQPLREFLDVARQFCQDRENGKFRDAWHVYLAPNSWETALRISIETADLPRLVGFPSPTAEQPK